MIVNMAEINLAINGENLLYQNKGDDISIQRNTKMHRLTNGQSVSSRCLVAIKKSKRERKKDIIIEDIKNDKNHEIFI